MKRVAEPELAAADVDRRSDAHGMERERAPEDVLGEARERRVLPQERAEDVRRRVEADLRLLEQLLERAGVMIRVAVREDHAVDRLRSHSPHAEVVGRVGRRIHEDRAAAHPEEKARCLSRRIEAVARAEDGDTERRRHERRGREIGLGERATGQRHRRSGGDRFAIDVMDDDRIGAELDRDLLVEPRLSTVGHDELDEVVDGQPALPRHGPEVATLLLEVRPLRLGEAVGELARERPHARTEERLLENRSDAALDVAREHDEPATTLQKEEAVVGRKLELRDGEATPSIEQLAREHVRDGDVEPERHDVLDRLGRYPDLHRAGRRPDVVAAARQRVPPVRHR